MAIPTIEELRLEIESLLISINTINKDLAEIGSEQIDTGVKLRASQAAGNEAEAAVLRAKLRDLRAETNDLNTQLEDYTSRLQQARLRLANAESAAARSAPPEPQPTPPTTAGQTVNDDQSNNPNRPPPLQADANGRISIPLATTAPTTATQTPTLASGGGTTGIDQPVKTFNTTQATYEGVSGGTIPVNTLNTTGANNATTAAQDVTNQTGENSKTAVTAGAGANDDSAPASQQVVVDNGFNKDIKIEPQPNILSNFFNYTYSISVYLMSSKQYEDFVGSKKRTINGYNLLFQSGGAPTNVGGAQGALGASQQAAQADLEAEGIGFRPTGNSPGSADADAGRNPFFPDDFYIDSVSIDTIFPGKQTQASHMTSNLKFTVIEPGGITLLDRIYQAVQDNAPTFGDGPINYTAAQYMMVVRWYGYDQDGNLVRPGAAGPEGLSDPNATVEKFIPFSIKKINWSVANKLVSYEFECAPVGQFVAGGTARGTIPYDIELRNATVEGLLGGSATFGTQTPPAPPTNNPGASTTPNAGAGRGSAAFAATDPRRSDIAAPPSNSGTAAPAPAKADTAPKPKTVLTGGLIDAMNKFQKELVEARKVYQYPDEYEVVFANGAEDIKNARITLPGAVKNQSSTPMSDPASKNASSKDPNRQRVDSTAKNFSITAGQQILQAIELAIRNSSYIYNQAAIQKSEKIPDPSSAQKQVQGEENSNENKVPAVADINWYQITMEAIPKKEQYDKKRNDYAYKIRYIISKYKLQNFNSRYYPIPKFQGIHKLYRYWFTGENTDVLDYQAQFNALYNLTVSGSEPGNNAIEEQRRKLTTGMRELTKYVYQSASSESRQGAELDANEIGANASEALYSPSDLARCKLKIVGDPAWIQQGSISSGVGIQNFEYRPFLPDGTINFDSQQVMFAIEWQRPTDYDLIGGLADPYSNNPNNRKPVNSYVYLASKCVSEFRQGRFEQNIDGSLYLYPVDNLKNAASQSATAVSSDPANQRQADNSSTSTGANTGTVQQPATVNNTQTISDVPGGSGGSDDAISRLQNSPPTDGYSGANIGIFLPNENPPDPTPEPTQSGDIEV